MFLRYQGYSKRFSFDVIYSALQKSLRRGDEELAIEMGYEFIEYPNALKKRLIQNCSEDCPNLYLVNDIYNTPLDIGRLLSFIPVICKHIKNHDGCYGMRLACEKGPINEKPILGENHDDLMTLLRKCFYYITQHDELTFISFFQDLYPKIDLIQIYNFIGGNKTFLYMLCVWETIEYVHERYQIEPFNFDQKKVFKKGMKLPEFVYDKHVRSGPKANKTYAYFVNNLILHPRKEESDIEKEAKKLLIETDRGITEMFASLIGETDNNKKNDINSNIEKIDRKAKLLLIESKVDENHPKTYFCSLNDGKRYDRILIGPFENESEVDMQIMSDLIKQKLLSLTSSYSSKKVSYKNQICILATNNIQIDKNNILTQTSDSEENMQIYTGSRYLFSHASVGSLSSNEIVELLKILAFRKIIGTNKTCDKNIIHFNKHLYTINDPVLLLETPYMFESHLDKFDKDYEQMLSNNFKKVPCFLNGWKMIIRNAQDIPDNVKSFMFMQISNLSIKNNWKF